MVWNSCHTLDPYKPLNKDKSITIQVVALPWKWLFIYPEQQIATVNYIKIPIDKSVLFDITADAPMNSFWIPELGGQIFAMPGMKTKLHLVANQIGNYFGTSANLSGKGFSGMTFSVQAVTGDEFDEWTSVAKRSQDHLTLDVYKKLALPSENCKEALFVLQKKELYDWIVMKYMMPMKDEK